MPPLIAITMDRRALGPAPVSHRVRPPRAEVYLKEALVEAVRQAGGEPLCLPPAPTDPEALARWVLAHADGVVISGGAVDIHPSHYGEEVLGRLDGVDEGRASLELALARAALAEGFPILGVCGGMQAMAVATGGSLVQDIGSALAGALEHEQATDPAEPWHAVSLDHSPLREAFGSASIEVNSTHHQAVRDPGALRVMGWAPDGVPEALDLPGHPCAIGVQWHPEFLAARPASGAPFHFFLAAVRR